MTSPIHMLKDAGWAQAALSDLAAAWGTDFWSAADVLASCQQARAKLAYAATELDSARWDGMVLWQEMGDEAELLYVFSRPELRGQGLGGQLLSFWRHHCLPGLSHGRLFLEVRPSNQEAIKLYHRQGFHEVSRRRAYYRDGEDALILAADWQRPDA